MNTKYLRSGKAGSSATPELQCFITEFFTSPASPATATLEDLRHILLGNDLFITDDGEIMHRLDLTSLVIEVDTLIDHRGNETQLARLLVT